MDDTAPKRREWKTRLAEEVVNYLVIFAYLAVFFSAFAWHRRLILAEHQVAPGDYWMPLLEAAVLAKVVLILDFFKVGRRLEDRPLIVPTLYKSLVFGIGIALFAILEATVRGLIRGGGVEGGVKELEMSGRYELISRVLVKLCALVPFFAFRETGRVLGKGKLLALFWSRSGGATSNP